MTRHLFILAVVFAITKAVPAQTSEPVINVAQVKRIEKVLSSDDMQGRRIFTPGIDKAAGFVADEFKKAGLQPANGKSYFQEFKMVHCQFLSASGTLNGEPLKEADIVAFTAAPSLSVSGASGYETLQVAAGENLYRVVSERLTDKKNYFVVVDTSLQTAFNNLKRLRRQFFATPYNMVLVLSSEMPKSYTIEFKQDVEEQPLKNVVGMIPGKSRKDEYVIFSAHYDHLGIGKPDAQGDSIYNGANDDASGTTAVIMLANYFKQHGGNERTLIFAAFTGEEEGGYGSRYFSQQFDPARVMAMFNIEMIGTESKWGTNSAYITGYEKTDMGKILEKNLAGSGFTFYPDPYPAQNLFYRSDNATLARQGVPAHTISTSKMDSEKYYHTQEDEIGTLDMKNMAAIIHAIAISSTSIIEGEDTPSRVDASELR